MKGKIPKTLLQYIASYLVILILPIAVTVFTSYSFFMEAYRKEVIDGKLKSLTLQVKDYEMKIRQMENIVKQLEIESNFFNYDLEYSIPARLLLKDKLSGYRLISRYCEDILYYRRGDRMLYAATGSYNAENYGVIMQRYKHWPQKELLEELNGLDKPSWKPVDQITDYNGMISEAATFLYPLPYYSAAPYATVVFRIPADKLFGQADKKNEKDEKLLVANRDGRTLFRSAELENDAESILSEVLSQQDGTGSIPVRNEKGESLLAAYAATEEGDWVFVSVTPVSTAMAEVVRVRNTFSVLIWVSILFGISLLFLFAYLNYKPLRGLKEHALVALELRQGNQADRSSEVDVARRALDMLAKQRESMSIRLAEQKSIIRDLLLMRLVSGEFRNIGEFNARAQESGVSFSRAFFRVIVFDLEESVKNSLDFSKLIARVESEMGDNTEAHAYLNGSRRLVLVAASDDREDYSIRKRLKQANEYFSLLGAGIYIGVGNCYSETFRLHLSFMEASTALDYKNGAEDKRILVFREVTKVRDDYYNYPEMEMQELMSAVINNRRDQLRATLEQINKKLQVNHSHLFSRILAYETINTIFKAVQRNNQGFVGVERYCSGILEFNTASSVERMWEIVQHIAEDVMEKYMSADGNAAEKSTIQRIIEYIHACYDRNDFSIQRAAADFNMSQNNFSQHFKRHTGQSPLEYVNNLRIGKAKKLLAESDMTLKEVVASVGYCDDSGFIRRFKEIVGMTPGEYRSKYRSI